MPASSLEDPDLPPSLPLEGSAQRAALSRQSNHSGGGSSSYLSSESISRQSNATPSFIVSGPSIDRKSTNGTTTSNGTNVSNHSKAQALRSVLDSPPRLKAKPIASGTTPTAPTMTAATATTASSSSSGASQLNIPSSSGSTSSLAPPKSNGSASSASLMPPPSTSRLTAPSGVGGASGAASLSAPSSSSSSSSKQIYIPGETAGRRKVALAAGRSPLDWARLKSSNSPALREGLPPFGRIPMSEVKKHKTKESAWSVLNGMVYNITPYLEFHPGGEEELMRCAGRDGTRLFMLTHSWVNIGMIDTCCLGMVVKDE